VLVGHLTGLDVEQCLAQPHRDWTWLAFIDFPMPTLTAFHVTNWRDDSGSAACEHLGDLTGLGAISPLINTDGILSGQIPKIRGYRQQGISSDTGQE
jgi:hypothetical protein